VSETRIVIELIVWIVELEVLNVLLENDGIVVSEENQDRRLNGERQTRYDWQD